MIQVSRSDLKRVIVAIDPAVSHGEEADDTGIMVVARGPHRGERCQLPASTGRCPGHGYVLADLTCHVAPHEWARKAIAAYDRWQADRIVAEVNNGGDMVGETIHAVRAGVPYTAVNASRGKRIRAEPVAALDEQGRLHHCGSFPQLVDELTTWTPESQWSPNRLDALVWGMTALGLIGNQGAAFMSFWKGDLASRPKTEPDRKERERRSLIQRMMRAAPRFIDTAKPVGIDRFRSTCEHRWRDGVCVFCNSSQS